MSKDKFIMIMIKYLLGEEIPSKYLYSEFAPIMQEVFEKMVDIERSRRGVLNEKKN